MKSLDTMPINDVIVLYYEKHNALRQGDMKKLIELKNEYPELFNKEKDDEILKIIEYAKKFKKTERYKKLHQLMIKKKLVLINNESPKK